MSIKFEIERLCGETPVRRALALAGGNLGDTVRLLGISRYILRQIRPRPSDVTV